jgi:plasmid stabilization system protein ParE
MLSVLILPAAQQEIIAAQDWYEYELPGLGARFREALGHQIERMATTPLHFPIMLGDVRRARLHHFPYGLFFRQVDKTLYIVACFHSSRDPVNSQNRV